MEFSKPFSIICGENGVGKSTILHLVYSSLIQPERRSEGVAYIREEYGEISCVRVELGPCRSHGAHSIFSLDGARNYFSPDDEGLRVALFDPAMHLPAILNLIRGDANFAELLEPLGVRRLSEDELADVCYLVGREYDSLDVLEVEGVGHFGVFPYFRASVAGVLYGSEEMGFGELSLLLMYWLLLRLQVGSLLLLEEPETFVAPKSQRRLTEVLARICKEKDLMIIATTHSPMVAGHFLKEEITLVSRDGGDVTIASPPPPGVVDRRLELVESKRVVWLVEDALAARVLRFFLTQLGFERFSQIVIAGDSQSVVSMTKSLEPFYGSNKISFRGVLDGDERVRLPDLDQTKFAFLPGEARPEKIMRDAVRAAEIGALAAHLGMDEGLLRIARGGAAGEEDHEWVHAVCREIGMSLDDFTRKVMSFWSREKRGESSRFLEALVLLSS
ncbi:AAA family ATPase [Frateuria sp. GZRe14]|uniref:AAA family ATPase n=1 Tax=Frateuria sp. GZRe14 TaxID=3351534 RepID=UPI003EDC1FDC